MSRPALAALAALLLLAPAAPAQTTTKIRGVPAAGPATYDFSHVTKIGPSSAKTVLVLMPGYSGGAGGFTMVGQDIVERVPGLQVWAVDRRSQALEDTSMFERALRGDATLQQVYDYYLGWISDSSKTPRFTPPDTASLSFAKDWGLPTHLGDLRKVILAAKRGGRRVILGGHSLGASMTAIYAAWDFGGRPGYKDVDGLVLIDGGALGTFDDIETAGEMRERVAALDEQPFADIVGLNLPWAQGIFAGIGGLYALKDPTGRSPFVDDPLLPAMFKPTFQVTNRALLGYAFDQTTSPKSLGLIHLRAGGLAAAGDPRDWESGEVSPIARVAEFWAQQPVNGVEWYFPLRLSIDVDGANELRRNSVTRLLKLRPWHLRRVNRPLYAFETDLTDGRVLRGARRYIERSRVPRRSSVLVDRGSTTSHLDPLSAAPETNDFLKTVVPFLKRTMRRGR
jgi:pimeloyl-ACP methyl ester carboxylesterase